MKDQDYKELAERMKEDAFHRGCYLSVLVEDIYDERFWQCIIENVKPDLKDKIDFPNPTPEGTRGKDILKNFEKFVNKKIIICVDSDCEYLYKNEDEVLYCANYIYNTIVHSKENFQCNHLSLNEICKDLTSISYDFKLLFENISRKISPIFYVWIFIKKHQFESSWEKLKNLITNQTLEQILDIEHAKFDNIGDEDTLCKHIEDKVNNTLERLHNTINTMDVWYQTTYTDGISEIKKRLIEKYSITEEDILSYWYGHAVLEQFVEPFMKKIIKILKDSKIENVKQALCEASNKDVENTIRRIENIAQQDIKTKLNDSFKYLVYGSVDNKYMQKIKEKLEGV